MVRWSYVPALTVMGAGFLISQLLVLRAFLLVFQGNELCVGIVLGNWFLLEALGSWLWGKRAARARDPRACFACVLALLSLLLPATLVAVLASRFLPGGSPWEASGPLRVLAVSAVLVLPLALANGAAFVCACRLLEPGGATAVGAGPGTVYVLESAGAGAGGAAFTFLLVGRLSTLETAFLLGASYLLASLLLLHAGERRALRWVCASLLGGVVAGLLLHPARGLERWVLDLRWRPFAVERSSDSVYGNLTVLRMGDERVLVQNGIPTLSLPTPDLRSLEERVHLPLLAHAGPREVLLLGGGAEGGVAEALKHPVRRLTTLEIDPLLLRTVADLSPPGARSGARPADPRVESVCRDGRAFLHTTDRRYDAIVVHVSDPATLQLNRFFTQEFFRLARGRLRPGGVLAVTLSGSPTYLGDALVRMNRCVLDTLRGVFPVVRAIPGDTNLFLASEDPALASLDARRLRERIGRRALDTRVVQAETVPYTLDPDRERWLREQLETAPPAGINHDFRPALLSHVLAHRTAQVEPAWRDAWRVLGRVDAGTLLAGLLLLNLPVAVGLARGRRAWPRAVSYSIFTTGFGGMAVQIVVILSFQAAYGFLYQWIGLLLAGFMGGLAAGAWAMTRAGPGSRAGGPVFLLAESALASGLFLAATGWRVRWWGRSSPWPCGRCWRPRPLRASFRREGCTRWTWPAPGWGPSWPACC